VAIQFTPGAFRDIGDIEDYLSDRSPDGLRNVLASLKRTFLNIDRNANYGRPTQRTGVRIAIEPRYKYWIPYYVKGDTVWILRVYHSRRVPLDLAAIEIPDP
jgi:plasmid stabilization system protein ParE